ncbi:DUF4153 domain-containing protein [Algoriphagus kandeliae]|uniref:DUF4153 domain-containing protein n=1 Tax=Algoriphagus kandeliae TaxID=2562278 RepID=A0A4Y9QZH8_9BACT|nr:DUF4153 domain-containing protein [Algoriphagus kandeliae]TFV97128.1 DUF4153 domain-containing protein [Algoriphagus kandeliae]
MKELLQSNLDNPAELEKLYRKNKSEFKKEFDVLYPEIQDRTLAEFWHTRLHYESDAINWGSLKDWRVVIIASLLAGLYAKLPEIFSIENELFYAKNLGLMVFPFVSIYFIWINKLTSKTILTVGSLFIASLLYINILPNDKSSDTLILACIHLPLLLWAILGYTYGSGNLKDLTSRLTFLRFNGDAVVMGAILVLSGMLLSGITIGLFGLIGINIEKFYMEYIGIFGAAAIPLLATHLTQTNPQLVNKVSPIIAKIFSPIVLVMLVIYLGAIVFSGKDPYNDREFLLLFNLLLIGVMALIFFSIAESSNEKNKKSGTWILLLLSLVTLIVNAIALSAIVFRINEWGLTPNRLAVLGINVLMMIHLVLVGKKLLLAVKGKTETQQVGNVISSYLPIYFIWSAIVIFLFPILFGFS